MKLKKNEILATFYFCTKMHEFYEMKLYPEKLIFTLLTSISSNTKFLLAVTFPPYWISHMDSHGEQDTQTSLCDPPDVMTSIEDKYKFRGQGQIPCKHKEC